MLCVAGGKKPAVAQLASPGQAPSGADSTSNHVATALAAAPGNDRCADCGAAHPDWASINCVVLLCQTCAGVHRSLGTHVSKVREHWPTACSRGLSLDS
jgi:Arf-GAP/coiled-coil/ANK repeat/PH domain-containing protein